MAIPAPLQSACDSSSRSVRGCGYRSFDGFPDFVDQDFPADPHRNLKATLQITAASRSIQVTKRRLNIAKVHFKTPECKLKSSCDQCLLVTRQLNVPFEHFDVHDSSLQS